MDKYNLEYKGVVCTAVDWEADPEKFVFAYHGKEYVFKQKRYTSQSADTDHIRCVIDQFLEDFGDVVQVVRCRDCKHKGWVQESEHGKSVDFCRIWDSCIDDIATCFCSYEERK